MKPFMVDLCCGLGGWAEGGLLEGYDVVGFDIEQHVYGEHRYPAQLVLQDVTTLCGEQFRDAALIVASPPCQEYSYMAMPWTLAKAKAAAIRADTTGTELERLNRLFDACFRIQREACAAAGHHIPLIVENVRGAQPWVGPARWNFGSFYLWGDVPALMPPITKAVKVGGLDWKRPDDPRHRPGQAFNTTAEARATKNNGGSWFAVAHNTTSGKGQNPDGRKLPGFRFDGSGRSFQSASVEGCKQHGSGAAWWDKALDERRKEATAIKNGGRSFQSASVEGCKGIPHRTADHWTNPAEHEGLKNGNDWFGSGDNCSLQRRAGSKSTSRKFASAMIARIPLPLSRYIAATFRPREAVA